MIKMIVVLIAMSISVKLMAQTENLVVVSADKMNVLYIGIDNPVSIAVPGIASDKIKVSINNGTISGSNGKYIIRVDKVMETIIEVSAEIKPGETQKLESSIFRIKRIPDPIPCIGNNCNSNFYISKEELLKDPQINVSLNLPFDFKFEVISFSLTYVVDKNLLTETAIGNKFTQQMIDAITKLADGSKVYIEDIKVKGPDGALRMLPAVIIKLAEKN